MINGELIIDNFAGVVRGGKNGKHPDLGRGIRTVEACVRGRLGTIMQ